MSFSINLEPLSNKMFIWLVKISLAIDGVSDCHMISTFIKGNTPNCVHSKIQYRSFKDFDVNKYISDLDNTVYLHDSSECVD
jgi:hypothetical protein